MRTSQNTPHTRNTQPADDQERATVSPEEQARRREAMRNALVQVRLEKMEPDPIFFEYAERYARGDLTLEEALADYTERVVNARHSRTTAGPSQSKRVS